MAALTEQDFRLAADRALEQAQHALLPFVVSPNAPVRQVWVSALSRSFKLSWDEETSVFALDGESLDTLIKRLAREHLAAPAA
jgi:hypothetical protein